MVALAPEEKYSTAVDAGAIAGLSANREEAWHYQDEHRDSVSWLATSDNKLTQSDIFLPPPISSYFKMIEGWPGQSMGFCEPRSSSFAP